jgi:hypothetical protein
MVLSISKISPTTSLQKTGCNGTAGIILVSHSVLRFGQKMLKTLYNKLTINDLLFLPTANC